MASKDGSHSIQEACAHVTELKERGNRKLAAKDFEGALCIYAEALRDLDALLEPGRGDASSVKQLAAALHSNSAQALMKQKRWLEAIDRCHAALRYDPSHSKSSWRGASCAVEVGMRDVAIAFAENGLLQNPSCAELLDLRSRLGPLYTPQSDGDGYGTADFADGGSDDEIRPASWHLPACTREAKRMPLKPGKEKGD
ncbi:Peptidyl-prolyl cis-trans isomerase D [Symbiodinium microadriaticum]|uniref:Peptidyl-prolyl cis-trans isomerase D n=1 Tax=Symbiodinium microadriaticum TaxID=2951 RepID=A0A1Q9C9T9_SYMMI|nr:Peptidyl-prolyl cis-trans isomerase D [Symbiodinium microadriaticum]